MHKGIIANDLINFIDPVNSLKNNIQSLLLVILFEELWLYVITLVDYLHGITK